jgi:Tol biopolymer transport system component
VWIAIGDHIAPALVATLTAADINFAGLAPWPALSPAVLLAIGHISPGGASRPCTDLYLVAADGSAVTRLTHDGIDTEIGADSLSPDGTEVAYTAHTASSSGTGAAGTWFAVVNRHGIEVMRAIGVCPFATSITPAWSLDGRRVALSCGGSIDVFDPATGGLRRLDPKGHADVAAMSWTLDGNLMVATVDPSAALGSLTVWTVDPVAATWTLAAKLNDANLDWMEPFPDAAFSPDRRSIFANAAEGQFSGATWVLDIKTSHLHQLLAADQDRLSEPMSWTADGSAVVYLDVSAWTTPTLRRQPLDGSPSSVVGVFPPWSRNVNGPPMRWQVP